MEKATFPQASQVLKLIDDQDPSNEDLQAFIGSGLICDFFEAKRRGKKISRDDTRKAFGIEPILAVYKVVVDFGISLAEMIKAGNYDYINDDITSEHFPIKGEGKWEVEIALLHFNSFIASDEAIKKADDPVILLPELLALGAQYPELQKQFPIVALGSVWQDRGGHRYVPDLWRDGVERRLYLFLFERDWLPDYRFAVARKRQPLVS